MHQSTVSDSKRVGPRRVLLLGTARSGTSWLGHTMGRAPGVRFYYEPDNVDADPTGARAAGRSGFGPYPIIDPGQDDNPFTPLWDMVFAGRFPFGTGRRRRMRPAARAALRVPRAVRDPLVRRLATLSARRPTDVDFTIVKTIYAVFSLDWLVSRYQPEVVTIQRHPFNVASSWRQLKIPLFDLASRPAIRERYLEPLGIEPPTAAASELARITWVVGLLTHVLGEAVDRHPGWHVVTHEDLCADPATSIRSVFDRVGLTWTSDVERFLAENNQPGEGLKPMRVTADQPNRWRERLNQDEVAEVERVLGQFPRRGWIQDPALVAS